MIDLHSHVLYGVDDGSDSLDTSLDMLWMAADSGVDTLVTTPHCNIPGVCDNYADEALFRRWERLKAAAERERIPIRILRGMEVFTTPDMPKLLKDGKFWTLNGTRYLLMEFSFDEDPYFCWRVLRQCQDLGYFPVLAHPERYYFVQNDPSLAFEWCTEGIALQVNKGSLLGRFGPAPKEMGDQMLRHGLCACVASDAHGIRRRSTNMTELWDYLCEEYGQEYARLLLEENPSRILKGQDLLGYQPIPFR